MDQQRTAQNGGASGASPSTPGSVVPKPRETEGAPPPVASPTASTHSHSIPQSTPHHHHHHHHHPHAAPINPSDRPGYATAALPQSAGATPSQRAPTTMAAPNPIGGASKPYYGFGDAASSDPYRSSSAHTRLPRRSPPPAVKPPSVSPQPAPGAVRPEVPMFGGMRSLPSPFDSSRDGPSGPSGQQTHHRTGSSSSQRAGYPQQMTSAAPAPRRELTPPHQARGYPEARRTEVSRSPTTRPPSQTPTPQLPSSNPSAAATGNGNGSQQRHPSASGYPYSYATAYHPSGRQNTGTSAGPLSMGLNKSAASNPLGPALGPGISSTYDRDRERERERLIQKRIEEDREDARRERDYRAAQLRILDDQKRAREEDDKRAQGDAFLADVRRRDREDEERRKAAAAGKSASSGARPGYPQEPGSMISQVAPVREPRPYTYKAEPLPNNPPSASNGQHAAAAQRDRDYYNPRERERERERDPRENRSRMDLAVEEQNKRSATAAVSAVARKRKKEDTSAVSSKTLRQQPTTAAPAPRRDWRDLTEVGKPATPVDEKVVKRWWSDNKTERVYSYEYNGSAISDLGLEKDWIGGRVEVRIGPGYLGRAWRTTDEDGWAEADTSSHGEALGLNAGSAAPGDEQGDAKSDEIWGTNVYTDDSAIGCILVHGGYLRWAKDEDLDPDRRERRVEADGLEVVLRILPPLTLYVGNAKNGIKSHGWGNGHDGFSVMVESLKRIPNYRTSTLRESGRKRLKSRVRDFNSQRIATEGERGLAGEREALFLVPAPGESTGSSRAVPVQAFFKYQTDGLADWLVKDKDRSIWGADLELKCGSDVYMLHAKTDPHYMHDRHANLGLISVLRPPDYTDETAPPPLPASRYTFTNDGLVVRTDDKSGSMYLVDGYRWLSRGAECDCVIMDTDVKGEVDDMEADEAEEGDIKAEDGDEKMEE